MAHDSSNDPDMIDELDCLFMVDLRLERTRHIVNSVICMTIQCWSAAGAFVEVCVSILIRCLWDAGPVGSGSTSEADMEGDGCVVF